MIKHSAAAGLALALVAGSAFAADLPYRKAPLVEPAPAPFSWTGLYGGINIGYGFGDGDQDQGGLLSGPFTEPRCRTFTFGESETSRTFCSRRRTQSVVPGGAAWSVPNDLSGVLGGGQAGYNYQFNQYLVVGLEADVQASDVHSQGNGYGAGASAVGIGPNAAFVTQNKSVDWFGTVRGRIGLTLPSFPGLMVYGTGGLAYGNVVSSFNASDFYGNAIVALSHGNWGRPIYGSMASIGAGSNFDDTKVGWTVGGGVEYFPFLSHPWLNAFSVKLEYLYTDLGSTTLYGSSIATVPANGPLFAYQQTSSTRFSTVRLGVNWHFNPFVSAPVLAKY